MAKNRLTPRLRTANKILAPYKLNKFPASFHLSVAKEIIYLLATKGQPSLEGNEWERIFAVSIGASWEPSNIGLDDVVLGNTAWGAKTVKNSIKDFKNLKRVRLISGRNSLVFSYGDTIDTDKEPDEVGEKVLEIWNDRVISVRERFENLRTVVLVKSNDLSQVAIFEHDTIIYRPELFRFEWNKSKNLEGFDKRTGMKMFTWQPHGSQFTIHQEVPKDCLILEIQKPPVIDKQSVLDAINFTSSWVRIVSKK
jgi:hypothetical protein